MSDAPACPNCQRPLDPSVIAGPPQAVVRCASCNNLILWSNGRVVRAAKSTQMGIPAVPATPAPVKKQPPPRVEEEPKPEEDALAGLPPGMAAAPPPEPKPAPPPAAPVAVAAKPPAAAKPLAPMLSTNKTEIAPKPVAKPATPPAAAKPVEKPAAPKPVAPPPAAKPVEKPAAPPPVAAKPIEQKPVEKPAPAPAPATAAEKKTISAAVVAPVPAASGPMVNPTAWFEEETSVDRADRVERRDGTGPQPLPPPPPAAKKAPPPEEDFSSTAPQGVPSLYDEASEEPTRANVPPAPLPKTMMAEAPKPAPAPAPLPKTVMAEAPKPVPAPLPKTVMAEAEPALKPLAPEPPRVAPLPKTVQAEAPKTVQAEAPKPKPIPLPEIPNTPTHLPGLADRDMTLTGPKGSRGLILALTAAGVLVAVGVGATVLVRSSSNKLSASMTAPPKTTKTAPATPEAEYRPDEPSVGQTPASEKEPFIPPTPRTKPERVQPSTERAQPSTPEPAAPAKPVATRRGRKVVVDYDKAPPAPTPPSEDPKLVEKAREAYHEGNAKLFAGDAKAAVRAYQSSLDIYPGYIAGYRGLGLAYAQQGQNKEAINALRTYLTTVPTAKDAALVKHRLDTLERR
jgi:hypothetical protein